MLCSIPLLQLALIVNWLFQKEILGSYYGRNCPNRCKIVYCMSALIFLTVAIISVYPAKPAVFMSDENPTTPFWLWGRNKLIPIIAGFSSLKYFVLAIEDRGDFLHDIIARPFVWITLKTLGFKTKGRQYSEASFGSQWKLDSDRAICFFLARGYCKANSIFFNGVACVAVGIVLIILWALPDKWGVQPILLPFTSGSAFVEVLIILFNVWNGLGGPTIRPGFEVVDYRNCPLRSHEFKSSLDQAKNYIFDWTWLHCSKDVVQSHCNQYLSEAKLSVADASTSAGCLETGLGMEELAGFPSQGTQESP